MGARPTACRWLKEAMLRKFSINIGTFTLEKLKDGKDNLEGLRLVVFG